MEVTSWKLHLVPHPGDGISEILKSHVTGPNTMKDEQSAVNDILSWNFLFSVIEYITILYLKLILPQNYSRQAKY